MTVGTTLRGAAIACFFFAFGPNIGCVSVETLKVKPGVEGTDRSNYYQGMVEMVGANYLQANTLFTLVARTPSYVKYGALAQLRLADVLFLQGRYRAATAKYVAFVAQHPSNPNVPYARFRAAQGYYEQAPSDLFILPPAHEGDQTLTREARRELARFLRDFPISRFAGQARTLLASTEKLLCDHELYVANFYEKRDKPNAVALRLNGAIETYPKCALTEENVLRLASSYAKGGHTGDAIKAYALYLEKFPAGTQRARVEAQLKNVKKQQEAKPAPSD